MIVTDYDDYYYLYGFREEHRVGGRGDRHAALPGAPAREKIKTNNHKKQTAYHQTN